MTVKLSPTLPKPDTDQNGLIDQEYDLLTNPKQRRIAVIEYDAMRTNTENRTGVRTPVVGILSIEPIEDPDDMHDVWTIAERAAVARTGRPPLMDRQTAAGK